MIVCIFSFTFAQFNLDAANSIDDIKLFSNSTFDAVYFGSSLVSSKIQINNAIKPYGNPSWGTPIVITDPDVSVIAYDAKIDTANNMVVGWVGENTVLGIYSLYLRIYLNATATWQPIEIVSDPSQNLTTGFAISINTRDVEIFWTSYDSQFNIINHSATFSIE
jgi:hypothetical protein